MAPFFNTLFLTVIYAMEAAEQQGIGSPCGASAFCIEEWLHFLLKNGFISY